MPDKPRFITAARVSWSPREEIALFRIVVETAGLHLFSPTFDFLRRFFRRFDLAIRPETRVFFARLLRSHRAAHGFGGELSRRAFWADGDLSLEREHSQRDHACADGHLVGFHSAHFYRRCLRDELTSDVL